ncbi:hypothetical protein QQ045_026291 [Rhodiola kirilowii]
MDKISLPRMVMRHLEYVCKCDKHSLPYTCLLKKIMTFHKVYGKVDDEIVYFRRLEMSNLKRMHFRREKGGGWVKIHVADVGIGVDNVSVGDSKSLEEFVPNSGLTLEDLQRELVTLKGMIGTRNLQEEAGLLKVIVSTMMSQLLQVKSAVEALTASATQAPASTVPCETAPVDSPKP